MTNKDCSICSGSNKRYLNLMRLTMAVTIKKTQENTSSPDENCSTICLPDHDANIAELAYYKAENRGFEPGHELEDWYTA